MTGASPKDSWDFWIDRGGTFTDVVGRRSGRHAPPPTSCCRKTRKPIAMPPCRAFASCSGLRAGEPIPPGRIGDVSMGTTVATNALLERRGERTPSLITKGFRDALRIGYQARPKIFARHIVKPEMLYERVVEVDERVRADGTVEHAVDLAAARARPDELRSPTASRRSRSSSCTPTAYPQHERAVAALARELGFPQVSVSHEISPLIKLVGRGDTTVVDAYLSPILRRYIGGRWRPARRMGEHGAAPDVHDVVRRAHCGRSVPGQGRDPVGAGRRRGRHGGDRPRRRFRPRHRLRHGRHLDRRRRISTASTSAPSRPRWRACACARR